MAGEENPLAPLGGRPASPSPSKVPPGASLYIESDVARLPIPPTVHVPPPIPGASVLGVTRSVADEEGAGAATGPSTILGVVSGRYELETVLGQGGMGAVYRCFDRHLKRPGALKMILPEKRDRRKETRFLHEARAMARLQHPGCVQVYDVGVTAEGAPYFVMELVAGEPLVDLVERRELSPGRAALLLHQIAGALHCAHEIGIIHRDVKPHNILVGPSGAKLADFGIVKDEESATHITAKGSLIGTLAYMPPEQTGLSGATVDRRSDVYALGATLYECLVGSPPFQGPRQILINAIIERDPTPPRRHDPEVPLDLEVIALKCLKKAPEDRYQTALELQEDLGRYLAGEPVLARKPSRAERGWVWLKKRRRVVGASLAAGLAVALAFGGVLGAGVVRDRSVARVALDRGEELFAKGKFEEAEAAFTEAARFETSLAAPAREKALRARAWRFAREGEAAFAEYAKTAALRATAEAKIEDTSFCESDQSKFEESSTKQERAEAFRTQEATNRRLGALQDQITQSLRKAVEVSPAKEIADATLKVWAQLHDAIVDRRPGEAEDLATEVDTLSQRCGLPNPLHRGSLSIATRPAGAVVHLYRYTFDKRRGIERPIPYSPKGTRVVDLDATASERPLALVPSAENDLGRSPIAPMTLPTGEYLVTIECEGYYPARVPALIHRTSNEVIDVALVPVGLTSGPTKFVFVAGGVRRSGAPLRFEQPTPAFFMQEREVTFGEWRQFFTASGSQANLLPLGPTAEAVTNMESYPDLPLTRITPEQAQLYADWFTKTHVLRAGWSARLPKGVFFFRALRGPFPRVFAWGDLFDPTFCDSNGVWNEKVKRDCPVDESPFGVRDLTGSVSELTRLTFGNKHVALGGSYVDGTPQLRALSMGGFMIILPKDGALNSVGFRLVLEHDD